MSVKQTVRVIRTWDVEVDAEYGDTNEDLMDKVSEKYLDDTASDAESRLILERSTQPQYASYVELKKAEEAVEMAEMTPAERRKVRASKKALTKGGKS